MTSLAMPQRKSGLQFGGIAHMNIVVPSEEAHKAIIQGTFRDRDGRSDPGYLTRPLGDDLTEFECHLHNAFVNQGLQGALDSMFGDLTASRITHIGLSADTSAVTATTTSLDPAGNTDGTSIKVTSSTSRTNQTVSTQQTWTQADVTFAIRKIGLLRGSAATAVSNIIGGTGGAAPYNEPFTIDLTTITTWSLTMGIDVTATAS